MTPTETMIDVMSSEGFDSTRSLIVIYRRQDGTIGYRVDGDQHVADSMGLLDFVRISIEHDLKRMWSEER